MDYTKLYRDIYSVISEVDLPHERKHKASIRIADALSDIYIYTNKQFPEAMEKILEIAENFISQVKIGGYDLDDKGYPIGLGTRAAGLKNNK